MDVGALRASPIGKLVPISGTDWQTGRAYRHFAYVPDPLPDDVVLSDATRTALAGAGAKLARLDRAARRVGHGATRRDSIAALLEPGSACAPACEWARGKPLTIGLANELQAALVRGARGDSGDAGRLRRGDVFLGSQAGRIERAQFVPAPHGPRLAGAFEQWLQWLNRTDSHLSPIVQAGLAHYQLETLHPYSDGNGRVGRLAIVLALVRRGVLKYPILAVSPWVHAHETEYVQGLLELRRTGDWDAWLEFFAAAIEGVAETTQRQVQHHLDGGRRPSRVRRTTSSGNAGRRRPTKRDPRSASVAAAVLAAVALGACGSSSSKPAGVKGNSEVAAAPIMTAGANPFTPSVGTDKAGVKPPVAAASTSGGPARYVASLPGLYGGTLNYQSCDAHKLVGFLEQNPSKAGAWASTLGISTTDIRHYVSQLTPVLLRTDTRVTNHGYVNGVADPIQSVLQAGTAVFLNTYGEPVVKCYCGNPLTPPELLSAPVYIGPRWTNFSVTNITIIQQSPTPIDTYTLYDPNTGTEFKRTSGQHGKDIPVNAGQANGPSGATGPTAPSQPSAPSSQTPTGSSNGTPSPSNPKPAENPSVSLSPNPATQGDTVTLSGSGFAPGAALQITVNRPDGVVEHYPVTAGSDGSATYAFSNAAGNAPLGTYNVTVTDTATGASASASINVVAAGGNSNSNSGGGSSGTVT